MSIPERRPPSGSAEEPLRDAGDHGEALNPLEPLATGIEKSAAVIIAAQGDGLDHSDVRDMAFEDVQRAAGNTVLALYMDLRRRPGFWAWLDRPRSIGVRLAAFLVGAALMAVAGLLFGAPGLLVPGYVMIPLIVPWLGYRLSAKILTWRYRVRPPDLGGNTYSTANYFLGGLTIAYLAAAPISDNWRWSGGVYFVPPICALILAVCMMPWMYAVAKDDLVAESDPATATYAVPARPPRGRDGRADT